MSSGIPMKSLSPSAQAIVNAHRAAARANGPTDFQKKKISERIKKGKREAALAAMEFLNILEKAGVERPEMEFQFNPERLWKFDFAWPRHRVALEQDGGHFIPGGGGHGDKSQVRKEHERSNSAGVMHWVILRVLPDDLLKPETAQMVKRALRGSKLRGA